MIIFIYCPADLGGMAGRREPQIRYQCLSCYRTHKTEQDALKCCGSAIQGWMINYKKWGRGHWYGR